MSLLVRCPDFRGCNVHKQGSWKSELSIIIEVSSFKLILSAFVLSQDVVNDIDGAQKVGMKGILVKTGKQITRIYILVSLVYRLFHR